jgi:hypothetical protein
MAVLAGQNHERVGADESHDEDGSEQQPRADPTSCVRVGNDTILSCNDHPFHLSVGWMRGK